MRFIEHKADVFEKFKEYEKMISNKFGRTMNVLRADNGRDYCSTELQ